MKRLKPVMPIEVIEWEDAHSEYGWSSEKQYITGATTPLVCQSAGFKLHEDCHQVVLVQSKSGLGNVADSTTILKKNIVSRRTMK